MKGEHVYDVVIIGGGPHGITYANWLKQWRPQTRVAIIERRERPGFKIGESLLSAATRSFMANGLSQPVLRRLFGNKSGIRFWWTSEESDELHRHIDVVDIEETFQVERRVLETAMQEATVRRGVELFTGTRVDIRRSKLDGRRKKIVCQSADGSEFTISARMVCDASGPTAVLGRHLGLYRKAPERNQTFTTNSYYAYFRQKKELPVKYWDDPATRHICFPEGWMWFINLTSWEATPDENLRALVCDLLDQGEKSDDGIPSRQSLMQQHGCTTEPITSIGFTVRADRDDARRITPRAAFEHYRQKYPAIDKVLKHYDLVEDAYDGERATYGCFRDLVHDSVQYAGDGWCLIGDAAAFVNPLFSPGLNLGSGSCYLAARATVDGLNRGDLSASSFSQYEEYMRAIYDALLNETDLYYRSFDHVDTYESALTLKIFFAVADVINRSGVYTESDLYVHDLLDSEFRERVDMARKVMREGAEQGEAPEHIARRVRQIVRPFVRAQLARPDVRELDLSTVFNVYTSDGRRMEKKRKRARAFGVRRCERCRSTIDNSLKLCPVCGIEQPEQMQLGRKRRKVVIES